MGMVSLRTTAYENRMVSGTRHIRFYFDVAEMTGGGVTVGPFRITTTASHGPNVAYVFEGTEFSGSVPFNRNALPFDASVSDDTRVLTDAVPLVMIPWGTWVNGKFSVVDGSADRVSQCILALDNGVTHRFRAIGLPRDPTRVLPLGFTIKGGWHARGPRLP